MAPDHELAQLVASLLQGDPEIEQRSNVNLLGRARRGVASWVASWVEHPLHLLSHQVQIQVAVPVPKQHAGLVALASTRLWRRRSRASLRRRARRGAANWVVLPVHPSTHQVQNSVAASVPKRRAAQVALASR